MTKRILLATRKGLFDICQQAKGNWQIEHRSFLGEPVSMVLRDPNNGAIYAALNHGHFGCKLHRSDDDGKSWTEVSVPSYEGVEADVDNEGKQKPAPTLKLIWALEVDVVGTLWAGTIPGGLFKSTDCGQNWQLNKSLWHDPMRSQWFGGGYDEPGIHSICIDPRNANKITLGVSCGGIWLSENGGETWRVMCEGMWADYMPPEQKNNPAVQDPHRLVQCKGAPDNFWVQHHNGIFRTVDACKSWKEVRAVPSSFGFAVAVHPRDPNIAWFVPATKDEKRFPVNGKFVVSKTNDGGEKFEELNDGLPKDESYDLVYRHGLAIDETGQCLVIASTTGNVWFSENGGKQWKEFSSNMPPVYAVAFI